LLNDYPIIIGKLSTSQTNSTSTTIFFIIYSYPLNFCNLQSKMVQVHVILT